jgi:hypothetical protein
VNGIQRFSTNSSVARIIGTAFAVGATLHTIAFALMGLGVDLYGPDYPAWRHVVMALVDASVAWVALRRHGWLFLALPIWAAEQALVNGLGFFPVIALAGVVALACERWWWRRSASSALEG